MCSKNILATINGTEKQAYKGKYDGFMVSIGSKYAVACVFDKFHLSGFFAMLMKHIINLRYFFDIRSGYYMFQYIMHEFFRIKDERNVFRGHTSRNSNVLWSVPLRVFYGCVWLVEAMKKSLVMVKYYNQVRGLVMAHGSPTLLRFRLNGYNG